MRRPQSLGEIDNTAFLGGSSGDGEIQYEEVGPEQSEIQYEEQLYQDTPEMAGDEYTAYGEEPVSVRFDQEPVPYWLEFQGFGKITHLDQLDGVRLKEMGVQKAWWHGSKIGVKNDERYEYFVRFEPTNSTITNMNAYRKYSQDVKDLESSIAAASREADKWVAEVQKIPVWNVPARTDAWARAQHHQRVRDERKARLPGLISKRNSYKAWWKGAGWYATKEKAPIHIMVSERGDPRYKEGEQFRPNQGAPSKLVNPKEGSQVKGSLLLKWGITSAFTTNSGDLRPVTPKDLYVWTSQFRNIPDRRSKDKQGWVGWYWKKGLAVEKEDAIKRAHDSKTGGKFEIDGPHRTKARAQAVARLYESWGYFTNVLPSGSTWIVQYAPRDIPWKKVATYDIKLNRHLITKPAKGLTEAAKLIAQGKKPKIAVIGPTKFHMPFTPPLQPETGEAGRVYVRKKVASIQDAMNGQAFLRGY